MQKIYTTIPLFYDLLDLPFETLRYAPIRRRLWQGLTGRILDAGVGTGRNMPYYPAGAEMDAIDLSPAMLLRAGARKRRTGASVRLQEKDVRDTGFGDASFDAIVASFLFCVLEDELQLPALRELRRVCKPGGTIRVLEYAWSRNPLRRAVMRLWAPWVRFAYGAAFDRDTHQYAEAAGLEIVGDSFVHADIIRLLVLRPKG